MEMDGLERDCVFGGGGVSETGFNTVLQSRCSITWATPLLHFVLVILELGSLELVQASLE
jgi:hypothetical protein